MPSVQYFVGRLVGSPEKCTGSGRINAFRRPPNPSAWGVRGVVSPNFVHFLMCCARSQLGMDLVIVHFILPVVMEHLKIRGPVRRASCWVLMAACGATGTRRLLLHPALLAGERVCFVAPRPVL